MHLAAFILISLAIILFWISYRQRRNLGLPVGRVIYSDTHQWKTEKQPFYDPDLDLTGKPDYLVKHKNTFIPIELKSNPRIQYPYPSHIYQLAAYCHLVQARYNHRPPYGILQYPTNTFVIDYTPELESKLHKIIADIRKCEDGHIPHRSHHSFAKCKQCGYRDICDQRLD
jgi:CRISPR-associated exonuclease Cas4